MRIPLHEVIRPAWTIRFATLGHIVNIMINLCIKISHEMRIDRTRGRETYGEVYGLVRVGPIKLGQTFLGEQALVCLIDTL